MSIKNNIKALILILCFGSISCKSTTQDTQLPPIEERVVAWVEDIPITKSELHHYMLLNKSEVYSEYYRNSDIDFTANFWTEVFNGQQPIEKLRLHALDDALTFKSQQILGISLGLPLHISTDFDELMLQRIAFNNERQNTIQNGGIIYGPISLSPRNYLDKIQDELVQASVNHLSSTKFKIDQEEILVQYKKYLESHRQNSTSESPASLSSFSMIWQNEQTTSRYLELVEETKKELRMSIVTENYVSVTL